MEPSESQTVYLQNMVTLMLVLHKRKAEHNVGWSYKWVLIFGERTNKIRENVVTCVHANGRRMLKKQKEKKKEARLRSRNHS